MSDHDDERVQQVIEALDPQPASEVEWPVSRRQTLRALAAAGLLGAGSGSATAESAGGVIADEATLSNYGSENVSDGWELEIDEHVFGLTESDTETIGLPDGAAAEEIIMPNGVEASEVLAPDGTVVFSPIPDNEIDLFERDDLDFYTAVSGGLSDWNITTSESFGPDSTRSVNTNSGDGRIQSDPDDGLVSYPERGDPFYFFSRTNGTSSFAVGYCYFAVQDQSGGQTPVNAYEVGIRHNDDEIFFRKTIDDNEVIDETETVSLGNETWWCGQVYWDTDDDGEIKFEVIDPSDWSTLASVSANDTEWDSGGISWRSNSSSGVFYDEANKGFATERFD